MSLVAGGVFWTVRALFALFPGFALRHPIKKYAAVAALLVGLIYMLLADFGAATERSYIMIAVAHGHCQGRVASHHDDHKLEQTKEKGRA